MTPINKTLISKIKQAVSHSHLIDINEKTRKAENVKARAMYFSLLNEFTIMDKITIAKTINLHKATYNNLINKHNKLITDDIVYRMQYNDLFLTVKKEIYDYEKMYKALLNDYKNLEIRYKNLKVELKVIQIKQEKPKVKTQTDFVAKVKQTINDFYKIDIDVKIRKSEFILGRAIYSAILMGKSKMQQSQIAKTLNLDRTTIYNCMKNHEDWMLYDKNYKKDYEAILNIIENEHTETNQD